MSDSWQSILERWSNAGLIDTATAERIRVFEGSHEEPRQFRWPILIAIGFGALMLGAGVLLFVSAHWDDLSPAGRFSLVLLLVAMFHTAGAFVTERFPMFASAMHGLGTLSLGAGIYLSAQIFNLQEHWPGGIMLWALGAWVGWWLRRDWVQAGLVALLTPAWLACEWIDATEHYYRSDGILGLGIFLLAIAYLSGTYGEKRDSMRRVLLWIGGIALIPSAIAAAPQRFWSNYNDQHMPSHLLATAIALAIVLPLLLAFWLRGKQAWPNALATVWVLILQFAFTARFIGVYIWYALACLALIAWGVAENRRERINLGVLGFGLTVLVFYFSEVMDKLGRSASLIGLGVLFLALGWGLERTRRRLVARVKGTSS